MWSVFYRVNRVFRQYLDLRRITAQDDHCTNNRDTFGLVMDHEGRRLNSSKTVFLNGVIALHCAIVPHVKCPLQIN